MEKKNEMGFIEKFEAACKYLGKKLKKSNNGAMIMIATSEGAGVSVGIEGNLRELSTLLAFAAIKNKGFKTILTNAIMGVEAYEHRNK